MLKYTYLIEDLLYLLLCNFTVDICHLEWKKDIFKDSPVHKHLEVLENYANTLTKMGNFTIWKFCEVPIAQKNRPFRRNHIADKKTKKRCLTGSRWANHEDKLPFLYCECKVDKS